MSDEPRGDINKAPAGSFGQQFWWLLYHYRITPRWGADSPVAYALHAWAQGHARAMEAEWRTAGLLPFAAITGAVMAAETEGRALLAALETEFPAGTDPLTDAAAQEAVRRIVSRLRGDGGWEPTR